MEFAASFGVEIRILYFSTCTGVAAVVELMAEPLYILATVNMQFGLRVVRGRVGGLKQWRAYF